MRQKYILLSVFLVILAAIVGLGIWYFHTPKPQIQQTTTTSTSTPKIPTPTLLTNAAASHVIQNGQYFTIDLQYPSATPLAQTIGSAADAAAVATLKNYSEQIATTFITNADIASITPTIAEDLGLSTTTKFTLASSYDTYTSPTTVSYVFTVYTDMLGAHPNIEYDTYTFDLKTGKTLSLSDLFISNSNYLSQLSSISRKILVQQQGNLADEKDFIDPGTTPTTANFKAFALDGQDLVVYFSPYQVAPYALGPQIVKIPVRQLEGFAR